MSTLALPSNTTGLALPGTLARRPSQLSISTLPPHTSNPSAETRPGSATGENGKRMKEEVVQEENDEDGEGEGDDGEGEGGRKRRKLGSTSAGPGVTAVGIVGTAGTGTVGVGVGESAGVKEYKYSGEISQMMFVFGEVQDPLLETVKLVEDIVRGQIVEIIIRARQLTQLRSSRFLSADDVIFLIRDDRGKVNRLRTYLSWKDVRKRAKDDESGEAGAEVEMDDAEKVTAKIRNTMVKLPWELLTPFSDLLKGLPSSQNREEDEEQDEDEMQAYQDSMQRLRDADEITKKMTKDEYVHYSECRQASFTYRKAKRFREFVNFSAYLDTGPNDDIVDILGFLSFEMVRTLCVKSLEVRERMEKSGTVGNHSAGHKGRSNQPSRKNIAGISTNGGGVHTSPVKRKSVSGGLGSTDKTDNSTVTTTLSPEKETTTNPPEPTATTSPSKSKPRQLSNSTAPPPLAAQQNYPVSLFAPPPSARQPLLPLHVLEAFAEIQREQGNARVGGMKNFRSGLGRRKLALV